MRKYGCLKNDLISILQSDSSASAKGTGSSSTRTRQPRKIKVFKNPITDATVENRGGNHKILKAWKNDYDLADINEWLESVRD